MHPNGTNGTLPAGRRKRTAVYAYQPRRTLPGTGRSVEDQWDACIAYAERNGWQVVDTYVDTDTRNERRRMLDAMRAGQYEAVVVPDLRTLVGVRLDNFEAYIDGCGDVPTYFVRGNPAGVDLSTATGRMMVRFAVTLAAYELAEEPANDGLELVLDDTGAINPDDVADVADAIRAAGFRRVQLEG